MSHEEETEHWRQFHRWPHQSDIQVGDLMLGVGPDKTGRWIRHIVARVEEVVLLESGNDGSRTFSVRLGEYFDADGGADGQTDAKAHDE